MAYTIQAFKPAEGASYFWRVLWDETIVTIVRSHADAVAYVADRERCESAERYGDFSRD